MLALIQDPEVPIQAGADFGGTQMVHPIGAAALGLMSVLALVVPRRWLPLPVILMLCFIPAGQRLVIATLDFSFLRILMVVVWARLFLRGDVCPLVWNHLDRVFVVWSVASIVTGTLQELTFSAFINRFGGAADAMMAYFFFRLVIRNYRDLVQIAVVFMACSAVVLVFFVIENRTSRNMFAVMGGVPEITDVRSGRLRCQGAFAHSILAGCFWACVMPFYFARGWVEKRWLSVGLAVVAGLAIVQLSASSTPVMAVLAGMAGAGAFLIRGALPWIRWAIVIWLGLMHFVFMNQPVWHLLARVDVVGGSTGWHRYHLVDRAIANFREWWMFGTPGTGHWGPGLQDVTNQFVCEGVAGGVTRLGLFVAMVSLAFVGISRSMRLRPGGSTYKAITWALGTAMFMHCVNFIGVTYFDQIVWLWFMTLAAVSGLTLVPGAPVARQLIAMRR